MTTAKTAPLEADVPLSQSIIWRLQREFYNQRGLKIWTEDLLPQYITNNPFIAEIYARIVFGFISDCNRRGADGSAAISPRNPLRIVELGAGPGKFSYLFLRNLTALLRAQGMSPESVRYYMTDASQSLIEAWRANSYLAEFAGGGILGFEKLQAGEEADFSFLNKREPAEANALPGPVVLIANYVFDSLPQDAFVIRDGAISEALLTTTEPAGTAGGADTLSRLELSFKDAALPAHRYRDETWNEILELYRKRLPTATVPFPVDALKTLRALGNINPVQTLVLAADKGYAHEDALRLAQGPPALEFHAARCFSQMVNFDAIGKCFEARGGTALRPDKHSASLSICAFLQGQSGDCFPATKAAYQGAQQAFGPDDAFTLLAWLHPHMHEMSLPQILSALRMTRWDPVALTQFFPILGRQVRNAVAERNDVRNAILRIWANHYPVSPGENVVAFQCGVILLELHFYEEAASLFKASQETLGASAATSYNLGLCSMAMGHDAEALALMREACELDPTFEPARLTRLKLEKQTATPKGA
jgi:tetratricopeptide (TPR) repeat protein